MSASLALLLAMPFARELTLLARGLLQAQALGVAVNRLRYAIFLLASLAVIVLMGVAARKLGIAMVWYDEVASIALAWLTYYGAALAALKRAHIGFPGLVNAMPPLLVQLVLIWVVKFMIS